MRSCFATMNHEGFVSQAAAVTLVLKQTAAMGPCVTAITAVLLAGRSCAKSEAIADGGIDRKPAASVFTRAIPGGVGYPSDISLNDCPAFGAPAATKTRPATFGSVPI